MPANLAYLVIREGPKWTDVFRLVPGQKITIGRAPTNQIVMKDDRCSRCHAEVYNDDEQWYVRDLDSRNGTLIGDKPLVEPHQLQPGEIIRIGTSQLAFVYDLAKAFPDSSSVLKPPIRDTNDPLAGDALPADDDSDSSASALQEPTMITHRRVQTKFLRGGEDDQPEVPKAGRAAAKLCRLAFELAKATDPGSVGQLALQGIFEAIGVDAGAILLLRSGAAEEPTAADLEVLAAHSTTERPYHRISPFFASTVLREGEAVLARNVIGDSTLTSRDSKGEIHALSVMCAPVRRGARIIGLIHLYSTRPERIPDPDDLEFTLAVADTVGVALQNLKRRQELAENLLQVRDENVQLRQRLGAESELVGSSKTMQAISESIARAAPNNATVLIRGESGVGKELVARAVHFSSPRRKGPFVCINCAALSESLLESELFGHEKGAFTGAVSRKAGKFEASHQGTLMLDEIGEMSPAIQAKFLRVLEGHPFERVGGHEPVKVDVRVIAATNRDLEKAVTDGTFRRDLYFRLHVLEITVPPLRKRPEDVAELAYFFFNRFTQETGRKLKGFMPRAMDHMLRYRWPGNVRELKNVVERAVVLAQGEYIDETDLLLSKLPTSGDTVDVPPQPLAFEPLSLAEMERRHIEAVLQNTRWNKSRTAEILGIERSTLDRKIRRYGLLEQSPGGAN
jgi:transcriptional regulator with GAF, ATPase, and Fis domain